MDYPGKSKRSADSSKMPGEPILVHGGALVGVQSIPAPNPAARPAADPPIRSLQEAYMEYQINRHHAPRTLQKYDLVFREWRRWARSERVSRLSHFTEARYWAFNRWMVEGGLSDKTRYDRLLILKQAFKWAIRNRLIENNPIQTADLIPRPSITPQPCFGPAQVARLLAAVRGQSKAIFSLMAYAGLRFGEVRELQWDDILWDEDRVGFLWIQRGGWDGKPKWGRHRRIPIHPELALVLRALPRNGDRLFHDSAGADSRILERKLLMELKDLCERCDLPRPRQYKLHTFRHTFASMCARTNIAYKYALSWLGHRRSDVLDLYYEMFDDTAAEAIRTIRYEIPPTVSDFII
jgi:integrase